MTTTRNTTFLAALACAAITATSAMAERYETGMQQLRIEDTNGDRTLAGFVWYPTTQTERMVRAHGNQVWEAITVLPDAEPAAGEFPIVVLSHGMFGNARNQAWLAQELVADGYIVAAIDHPGTTTFDRDADARRRLWKRPQDISRTIDFLTTDWKLADSADEDRIYGAGHSLGGWTMAALAGARYDDTAFDAFCESRTDELVCGLFESWNIAADDDDLALMQQDLSDERIDAFVLFDLGGTRTFSKESLGRIDRPMLVYGAPAGEAEAIDLDVEARAFSAALPAERVTYLEPDDYSHFDFLGVCTEQALDILKAEVPEDVYVCRKGTEPRRAKHDAIAARVATFFETR